MKRNTRTCFQCGKPRHFVADCPKKVENKDSYKHKSKTDDKYQSRRNHKHKHKSKHMDERRSRKESRGKARAMVGASDIDSSSAYSTSSSSISEDEGDRRKGTLQGFPPIATNPLGNTTISVAIGGYYCTETVIWLQFVCLLQHKI
jgi:hypothetical protein